MAVPYAVMAGPQGKNMDIDFILEDVVFLSGSMGVLYIETVHISPA
jgi:hypothetical protein